VKFYGCVQVRDCDWAIIGLLVDLKKRLRERKVKVK